MMGCKYITVKRASSVFERSFAFNNILANCLPAAELGRLVFEVLRTIDTTTTATPSSIEQFQNIQSRLHIYCNTPPTNSLLPAVAFQLSLQAPLYAGYAELVVAKLFYQNRRLGNTHSAARLTAGTTNQTTLSLYNIDRTLPWSAVCASTVNSEELLFADCVVGIALKQSGGRRAASGSLSWVPPAGRPASHRSRGRQNC